jgi:hypothetical protein
VRSTPQVGSDKQQRSTSPRHGGVQFPGFKASAQEQGARLLGEKKKLISRGNH